MAKKKKRGKSSQRRLPTPQKIRYKRVKPKKTRKQIRRRIKRVLKRKSYESQIKKTTALNKAISVAFKQVEDRARLQWQRAAQRSGIKYSSYRAKLRKRFKILSFLQSEVYREEGERASLIKRGKNAGKYVFLDIKTGKERIVTAGQFNKIRKLRAYWSRVRWIAKTAGITVKEARKYYDKATHDEDINYQVDRD